jgi:hypothetical protein
MIRHDTNVNFKYSKTDDRIFDLHDISQIDSNRCTYRTEQIIITEQTNVTEQNRGTSQTND